ncbi:hypothetical protein [Elizabethkingia anophelis]|nr:hypothetical protein [Elizabethkingia anophelis]MCT4196700.1 hypothetical protein [Elizabethkingia anophelis]MCT4225356.1 hypothetical protein [Elizabethkingia anophelis]MCT4306947.1 hypothetical protein [Elizabethkingia anophelis]HCZ8395984.1 hypothetical protein [Elizabethkingia anophelis]
MYENFPYLSDLITAIENIGDNYCKWDYKASIQQIERVFAYELYYQLKLISHTSPNYQEINFNGEISKKISAEINTLHTGITIESKYVSPDLVLHKQQIDSSTINQKLIIEIKAGNKSNKQIAKDILKLNYGIETLNFEFGVFISINTRFTTINSKLKKIFINKDRLNQEETSRFSKIIIVNYNNEIIECKSLYEILEID